MEKKLTVRHGVVIDPSLDSSTVALNPAKAERMREFWAASGAAAFSKLA